MEPFLNSDDDSLPEEDRNYVISQSGVEEILGWIRFQAQLCEMIHDNEENGCDDKEHEVALLMAFALSPWIEYYGLDKGKN